MLKERRIKKAVTRPSSPTESTPAERKKKRAMAAKRAMELIHKGRPDGDESWHDAVSDYIQKSTSRHMVEKEPKVRKPMSEEVKAMLKARREAKKSEVAGKFQKFWNKHEGVTDAVDGIISSIIGQAVTNEGIEVGVDTFLADMMGQAVALLPKKPRTKKNGQPYKKRESADKKDLRERREKRALKDEKKK
jgi:hypothetical protein